MLPYLIGAFSVICYASLDPIAKKFGIEGMPPYQFIGITMLLLSVFSFGAMIVTGENFSISSYGPDKIVRIVLFSFINFVGFVALLKAIAGIPIIDMELMRLLAPVVAGGMAFLVLGEPLQWKHLIGLSIMGVGLYVALR